MKYALYLPPFGPYSEPRTLAALARDAEQAGWDGFFLWDHLSFNGIPGWTAPVADPWVALAAIAMNTERIRIGTTVTPLPRRRPWKLARETVTLDHLSGGRLVVSVGTGGGTEEYDNFGEEPDAKQRGAMLDEGLDILSGLWRGEPFSYEGQHYHIKDAHFLPTPIQQPRIPVWVGGFWPNKAPMRRAAKWDGVLPLFNGAEWPGSIEQFRECVAYVQAQRQDETPFDIVYLGAPTPGDDPARAAEMVRPFAEAGATWWLEILLPFRFGGAFGEEWPLALMRERVLQGPPHI
jgi:probable F420-dependent oxidoreductase